MKIYLFKVYMQTWLIGWMVDEVYQLNFNDIKTLCHIHFPVAKCRQQKKILEVIIFTKHFGRE